jgi:hypothetical protein
VSCSFTGEAVSESRQVRGTLGRNIPATTRIVAATNVPSGAKVADPYTAHGLAPGGTYGKVSYDICERTSVLAA